jgi:hypothetical protein
MHLIGRFCKLTLNLGAAAAAVAEKYSLNFYIGKK